MDFETTFIAQVITVIGFAVGLSIVVGARPDTPHQPKNPPAEYN